MTDRYIMSINPQLRKFLDGTASEMVLTFNISLAEAIVRINCHWRDLNSLSDPEIILHEDERYWSLRICYAEVLDWRPDVDRSQWVIKDKPESDSDCWTIGYD